VTEGEAKTKWCFAFTASHTDPRAREYVGADATGPYRHHCIGRDCMAWRKDRSLFSHPNGNLTETDKTGLGQWVDDGHCGLAGKPS
jgi:hypothetical protein